MMCGLTGMAGNGVYVTDLKIFNELLYMSGLRGEDSTGVMIANTNRPKNHYIVDKALEAPAEFVRKRNTTGGILQYTKANIYMAHARYATVGKKTVDNAHPFEVPGLVGMHNGTLADIKYSWPSNVDDKGKTDSELMFRDMSEIGILETLNGLSPNSAFAISVYDTKARKLYLARNKHRPLYGALNKKFGMLYWSSEFYMLHAAADRNHEEIHSFYFQPDKLYEIHLDEIVAADKEKAPWVIHDIVYSKKSYSLGVWDNIDGSGEKGWTKDQKVY